VEEMIGVICIDNGGLQVAPNFMFENGRPIIEAYGDAGHVAISLDVLTLLAWLQSHHPELMPNAS
jgi:hypothetical protein